jgi:hypothetical protein
MSVSVRGVRRVVVATCVAGIGGMIAGSVAGNDGVALTAGLASAAAIGALMLATAVAGGGGEEVAGRVEERVRALVAAGADEAAVRDLVREAVRLGQQRGIPQ